MHDICVRDRISIYRSCMIYMHARVYHAYIVIYIAIRVFNSVEQVVEKLKIYSRFVDLISDVV